MKSQGKVGGPNQEAPKQQNPATKFESEKQGKGRKEFFRPSVSKGTMSVFFAIGVFVVGTVLLAYLQAIRNPEATINSIVFSNNFWLFAVACCLACLYGWIKGKDQLHVINGVLILEILVLAVILLLPVFIKPGANKSGIVRGPGTTRMTYAPVSTQRSIDYDDSGTNHLGVGVHHFTFTDSGEMKGPFRDKKEVKGSNFLINGSPEKRLMIIYDDGDTLRCWDPTPPHKSTWGKFFKMVALAPMEVEKDNY